MLILVIYCSHLTSTAKHKHGAIVLKNSQLHPKINYPAKFFPKLNSPNPKGTRIISISRRICSLSHSIFTQPGTRQMNFWCRLTRKRRVVLHRSRFLLINHCRSSGEEETPASQPNRQPHWRTYDLDCGGVPSTAVGPTNSNLVAFGKRWTWLS